MYVSVLLFSVRLLWTYSSLCGLYFNVEFVNACKLLINRYVVSICISNVMNYIILFCLGVLYALRWKWFFWNYSVFISTQDKLKNISSLTNALSTELRGPLSVLHLLLFQLRVNVCTKWQALSASYITTWKAWQLSCSTAFTRPRAKVFTHQNKFVRKVGILFQKRLDAAFL